MVRNVILLLLFSPIMAMDAPMGSPAVPGAKELQLEEKSEPLLPLPNELQLYIIKLMGDSLGESVDEIKRFRLVNKFCNELVVGHQENILNELKNRYGIHQMRVSARYGYPKEVTYQGGGHKGTISFDNVFEEWKQRGRKLMSKCDSVCEVESPLLFEQDEQDEDWKARIKNKKTKFLYWLDNADVSYQTKSSRITPLMTASYLGASEIVQRLLEKGADPNLKDSIGMTALMRAVFFGNIEAAELLIRHGAKINTNVALSQIQGGGSCCKRIICKKIKNNFNTRLRASPLSFALMVDDVNKEVLRLAMNRGLALVSGLLGFHIKNHDQTEFDHKQSQIIGLLLEKGANPHLDRVVLPLCAYRGNAEALTHLLEYGADPNSPCETFKTPLMWAAKYGHVECVNVLLKAGANPATKYRRKVNKKALDFAKEKGHEEIISILEPVTREAKKQKEFEKEKKMLMAAWFGKGRTPISVFAKKDMKKLTHASIRRNAPKVDDLFGKVPRRARSQVVAPAAPAPAPIAPNPGQLAQPTRFQKLKAHAKVVGPVALGAGLAGLSGGNMGASLLYGNLTDNIFSVSMWTLYYLILQDQCAYAIDELDPNTSIPISPLALVGVIGIPFSLGLAGGFLDGCYFRGH